MGRNSTQKMRTWITCGVFVGIFVGISAHILSWILQKNPKVFRHFIRISIIAFGPKVFRIKTWFVCSLWLVLICDLHTNLKKIILSCWKKIEMAVRQIDILGLDWIHWKPVVCQIFWRTEFLSRKYSYKTEERKTITKKNYNKIHHVSQFRQQHCQQDARSKQGSQRPWRRYTGDAIDSPILKHQLSELLSWSFFNFQ